MISGRKLSFVFDEQQATALRDAWRGNCKDSVIVCLDETQFTAADCRRLFSEDVEAVDRSDLGVDAAEVFEDSQALYYKFFPSVDSPWAARMDRWCGEALRRWMLCGVHSVRVIQSALRAFAPQFVWLPPVAEPEVKIRFDEYDQHPLTFDLVVLLCRRARIPCHVISPSRKKFRVGVMAAKLVLGQWMAAVQRRGRSAARDEPSPSILISNFDNDFHRQFNPRALLPLLSRVSIWLRKIERVLPAAEFIDAAGLPTTTRFSWAAEAMDECRRRGADSGAGARPLAGLHYLVVRGIYAAVNERRRRAVRVRDNTEWWEILFGRGLPRYHASCRLAAAYFLLLEYERSRSVMMRWRPRLLVTGDFWTDRAVTAAAQDLGVLTMIAASGITFAMTDLVERNADVVCQYGEVDVRRVERMLPHVRALAAGDVLNTPRASNGPRESVGSPRRVLIITSGRFQGWWYGSLVFDYPAYRRAMEELAVLVQASGMPLALTIKSHPWNDLYEMYDDLAARYGDVVVEHRRTSMTMEEIREYDLAVIWSTPTTFLAELQVADLPVVFFTGGLTAFGQAFVDSEGLERAHSAPELFDKLTYLLDDAGYTRRLAAYEKLTTFLQRYLCQPPRSFDAVVRELLPDLQLDSVTGVGAGRV